MAISLPGERSVAAAKTFAPLATVARWIARMRAARQRHLALATLMELDQSRLDDLGLCHADVREAMRRDIHAGAILNAARARKARS